MPTITLMVVGVFLSGAPGGRWAGFLTQRRDGAEVAKKTGAYAPFSLCVEESRGVESRHAGSWERTASPYGFAQGGRHEAQSLLL